MRGDLRPTLLTAYLSVVKWIITSVYETEITGSSPVGEAMRAKRQDNAKLTAELTVSSRNWDDNREKTFSSRVCGVSGISMSAS